MNHHQDHQKPSPPLFGGRGLGEGGAKLPGSCRLPHPLIPALSPSRGGGRTVRSVLALTLAITIAGAAIGCTSMEPAPVCDMTAIERQRQLVAAPSVIPGESSPVIEMPLNSVSITDFTITNKVYVRSINARRTATGTVELWSQIINCTDYPLRAELRTQFYDKSQAPAEPVSAWKRIFLDPRSSSTYRESSLGSDTARYYMVEMREGR
ncbi:MAG: hypothetical protein H7840_03435 [Alphaproteobacteria bacterium]